MGWWTRGGMGGKRRIEEGLSRGLQVASEDLRLSRAACETTSWSVRGACASASTALVRHRDEAVRKSKRNMVQQKNITGN